MPFEIDHSTRGLIFDLDGTLVNSMPLHLKAWHHACGVYGIDFSSDFLHRHTGTPAWEIAKILLKERGLERQVRLNDFLETKTNYFYSIQDQVREVEPVADIARKYHGILPMAVGTGGHPEAVRRTLEITGLNKYFDIVVTAEDVTNHKPDPETFIKCASMMGINPSLIQVFEDGDLGIEAAIRAGMMPVDVRSWYEYAW